MWLSASKESFGLILCGIFGRYNIVFMLLTYFLPIGSMTYTYARVGLELWGSKSIGECTQRQLDNIKSKRRVRSKYDRFISPGTLAHSPGRFEMDKVFPSFERFFWRGRRRRKGGTKLQHLMIELSIIKMSTFEHYIRQNTGQLQPKDRRERSFDSPSRHS